MGANLRRGLLNGLSNLNPLPAPQPAGHHGTHGWLGQRMSIGTRRYLRFIQTMNAGIPARNGCLSTHEREEEMENTRTPSASVQDWPWMNTSLSPDERATLLLTQMTLVEKGAMLSE